MTDDNDEITHKEFIAAQFFTPESEMTPTPPQKARKPRARRDPSIAALARYARALESQTDNERRAAIFWLADRYLGIKLNRHGF